MCITVLHVCVLRSFIKLNKAHEALKMVWYKFHYKLFSDIIIIQKKDIANLQSSHIFKPLLYQNWYIKCFNFSALIQSRGTTLWPVIRTPCYIVQVQGEWQPASFIYFHLNKKIHFNKKGSACKMVAKPSDQASLSQQSIRLSLAGTWTK